MLKKHKYHAKKAFTLTEVLLVIVIIAILSSLTIVTYTGAKQRPIIGSIQYDLSTNAAQLKLYAEAYNSYPTTLSGTNCPTAPVATPTAFCLSLSSGNTISAYSATQSTFSLRIQNTATGLSYQITDSTPIAP